MNQRWGLPPHSLTRAGHGTGEPAAPAASTGTTPPDSVVAWGLYVDGVRDECTDLAVATERATSGEGFVWLGLKDPSDEDMAQFATRFNLHPLAIEDAVEGHTRSKLEQFGDTLFAVISTVAYIDHDELTETSEIVSTGQIMLFCGPHFVMTVRRGEQAPLKELRTKMEARPQRLSHGTWEILYAVLDKVIDDYNAVVHEFEKDIEEVETAVFSPRGGIVHIDRVYNLKRELIEFRRAVAPLAGPLQTLATRDLIGIPALARDYFREVADHHTETRETIQSFDDVLDTILSAGLARASLTDNRDMRKISAFVAIAAIPTLMAGIYGMNFDNMPELHTRYGYFVLMGVMLILMSATFFGFRRNKWL